MSKILKIYSDGGSRGNPGPSACAFVIIDNGKVLHKESKYLGKKTNNEAEYYGLVIALEFLSKNSKMCNGKGEIRFYLDSELLVKQINNIYRVKSGNLKLLYKRVKFLISTLSVKSSFYSIPREKNKIADRLLNMEMDENIG